MAGLVGREVLTCVVLAWISPENTAYSEGLWVNSVILNVIPAQGRVRKSETGCIF